MNTRRPPPFFGLDASVRRAARHLPAALASTRTIENAASQFADIPAALSNWLYFEVRLDARNGTQVDISTRVQPPQRELLLATPVLHGQHSAVPGLARWWGNGGAGTVSQLWLEFDIPARANTVGPARCEPGIFIELTAEARLAASRTVRREAICGLLPHLLGHAPPSALITEVTRAVLALPPWADVMYVGAFPGRGQDIIRLCTMRMADDDVSAYLHRIGWPGDAAVLMAEVDGVCAHKTGSPRLDVLNIDVSADGIHPRIGFELALPRAQQYRGELPEQTFFDDLVRCAIVDVGHRDALRAWPGAERTVLSHELWPSLTARCVNHLKLVHVPGEPLAAKAYLAWSHRSVSARAV